MNSTMYVWLLFLIISIENVMKSYSTCTLPDDSNTIKCEDNDYSNLPLYCDSRLDWRVISIIDSTLDIDSDHFNMKFSCRHREPELRFNDVGAQTVKKATFDGFQYTSFNFDNNEIHTIERDAFISTGNNSVDILALSLNHNSLRELQKYTFSGLTYLNTLSLSDNLINHIDEDTFKAVPLLRELDLSSNRLKQLYPQTFGTLQNLMMLWMNNNQLHDIFDVDFLNSTMLQYAHLQSNNLSRFDASKWPLSISFLNLSHNHLTSGSFSNMIALRKLDLSYQKDGASDLVQGLRNLQLKTLRELYLSNCALSSINGTTWLNSTQLQDLDLAENGLESIDLSTFKARFVTINLRGNGLRKVLHVGSLDQLTRLDLRDNLLEAIDHDMFAQTKELKYLLLGGNLIARIDLGAFRSMHRLTELDLSHNEISTMHTGTFHGLANLLYLDLSNNQLGKLEDHLFYELSKLVTVNISYNRLQTDNLNDVIPHLTWGGKIDVRGNNWTCANLKVLANRQEGVKLTNGNDFRTRNLYGIACQAALEEKSVELELIESVEKLNGNFVMSLMVLIVIQIGVAALLVWLIFGKQIVSYIRAKRIFRYRNGVNSDNLVMS